MRASLLLSFTYFVFFALNSLTAAVIERLDFETPEILEGYFAKAYAEGELEISHQQAHAGEHSLRLIPTLRGGVYKGMPMPEEMETGHISFWFYDTIFDLGPNGTFGRIGWEFQVNETNAEGAKSFRVGMDNARNKPYWLYTIDNRAQSGLHRRGGWVKFDIVLNGCEQGDRLVVYADGIQMLEFEAEDLSMAGSGPISG